MVTEDGAWLHVRVSSGHFTGKGRFFRVAEMVRHILFRVFVRYIQLRGGGWQIESDFRSRNEASSRWREKWNLTVTHASVSTHLCVVSVFFVRESSSNKCCTSIFMKKKCEQDCRERRLIQIYCSKLTKESWGGNFCARQDRWSVTHREVNAHGNIHSHKCRLCPSLFLQVVCL